MKSHTGKSMLAWLLSALAVGHAFPVETLDSLLVAASRPKGGTAGAAVIRLRDDSLVWEHDAWRRMLPASTQKVLSAAAFRSILGGGSTISTKVLRSGARKDSVILGDLILEGGGDPSFARGADSTALDRFARDLRASGIRRVAGRLVVRDPLLKRADRMWPGSWDWDNSLADCDGAPSTGIGVDGNCPGDSSLPFPHRRVGESFRAALGKAGVVVDGADRIELGQKSLSTDSVVSIHSSLPIDSLLEQALAKSSNHDIETMGLLAGASDSVSSRLGGARSVEARLRWIGLDTARVHLDDLCGLSRKDAIAARDMARLLSKIARDPEMNVFPLLPEPGKGTLKVRFQKTLPVGARLRAKTGSLDGVSTLVGLLVPPGGDSLVFALFFQGHVGASTPIRFAQEQIVGVLAGGPVIKPTVQDTTPPNRKPSMLSDRPKFMNP